MQHRGVSDVLFTKVLIANRGAIATRIIRTLKRLNITSVAIYAQCDRDSLHVKLADEAWCLDADTAPANNETGNDTGDDTTPVSVASRTYLNIDKVLSIAGSAGAQAIHPGYGFLSENSEFARLCEAAGIVFIGPHADHIDLFGLKHRARELAQQSQVPLLPGSPLVEDLDSAKQHAQQIGYPVMLKSTAGGGGIGLQRCDNESELGECFDSIKRMGMNSFANASVFIEKFIANARHIEVQMFGDGKGGALAIGERDCSSQRRNQKVIEECPAPNLDNNTRQRLHETAERLFSSSQYHNIGTVEYILDADTGEFYFLEVNTRLQVEHGVTEEVYGLDLVEWMLRQAAGDAPDLNEHKARLTPRGHAIQARVYAEDPYLNFQPGAGLLSFVELPATDNQNNANTTKLRIDHWIETGIEVPDCFDPMLAKVIVHAPDRHSALHSLSKALSDITLYGIETNLTYLQQLSADPVLAQGGVTTRYLNTFEHVQAAVYVVKGGTQTTLQDYPGRTGYWHVGVPPSGPFDNYSHRLANRLLGNHNDAATLEITLQGPVLKFASDTCIVLTGAAAGVTLDDEPIEYWRVYAIKANQVLSFGKMQQHGSRAYLGIAGGFQSPPYLGSRATFTLGQFGGHNGRSLKTGDVLKITPPADIDTTNHSTIPRQLLPEISNQWQIRVIYGPHGADDFFTNDDIKQFFEHEWEVHYNSSRTGIRLIGPKPGWARKDGGEAGLHPSNIHDNAYAFGSIDFTGDMPVILGPDGPSLGGFVCPATTIQADLWKIGQLRAGDKVRFIPTDLADAIALERHQLELLDTLTPAPQQCSTAELSSPVVASFTSQDNTEVVYRVAGDHFLLIEYGEAILDIALRFRAHALMQYIEQNPLRGVRELTPGIRSLQIHYDSQQLNLIMLIEYLKDAERHLAKTLQSMTVPSRIVHLPLSFNDEACQTAIDKYTQSVRPDAPWCPSNLEFIRRINGLKDIAAVKDIVFDAAYLVLGLGDVYLGAPVATPVNPAHRLVTTKYNPARTWTAENSVGIGGSYLCVYGMEGPGGYQFVGRTLQMWNRYRKTADFQQPWLLRFFDQIKFYEVSHDELMTIRQDFPQGNYPLKVEHTQFSLHEYQQFIDSGKHAIDEFQQQRSAAFNEELAMWHATGQFNFEEIEASSSQSEVSWPDDAVVVESPVAGSIWRADIKPAAAVKQGDTLLIVESMKTEIAIEAPCDGAISQVLVKPGHRVEAGQPLVIFEQTS